MSIENFIEAAKVRYVKGEKTILDDVSFSVRKGEIFGLVGHNGAGKTSLLKIFLGLAVNYSGGFLIDGVPASENKSYTIGSVMDFFRMDESLTARQYLNTVADMFGIEKGTGIDKALETVGLSAANKTPVKRYSLGMKRRLLIARALINKPDIFVLDEPFNGIDPNGLLEMQLILRQFSMDGVTVIVTSHNTDEFGIMKEGQYVETITSEALSRTVKHKFVAKISDPLKFRTDAAALAGKAYHYFPRPDEAAVVFASDSDERMIDSLGGYSWEKIKMDESEIIVWKMSA